MHEPELVYSIALQLENAGWRTEREPVIGLYRPDLLARSPSGSIYAIEIKITAGTVHFRTIGHVSALRSGLAAFSELRQVTPVLLLIGDVTPKLLELARRLDVLLIATPLSRLETAAKDLAHQLFDAVAGFDTSN